MPDKKRRHPKKGETDMEVGGRERREGKEGGIGEEGGEGGERRETTVHTISLVRSIARLIQDRQEKR